MPFESNIQSVSQKPSQSVSQKPSQSVSQKPSDHENESLKKQVAQLHSQIQTLQEQVSILRTEFQAAVQRYVATCRYCKTRFDMLAHHYSIGLFDNLVYVKCPNCQKAIPIKGGAGGEINTVDD